MDGMTFTRWAILDDGGTVANVAAWDGVTPWVVPAAVMVPLDPEGPAVGAGWRLVGGEWVSPDRGPD